MSETELKVYTPDTEAVRRDYAEQRNEHMHSPSYEQARRFRESGRGEGEFDRWLAAHDAEVRANAIAELRSTK